VFFRGKILNFVAASPGKRQRIRLTSNTIDSMINVQSNRDYGSEERQKKEDCWSLFAHQT